jgi:ADP-ribose pyrophosphatase
MNKIFTDTDYKISQTKELFNGHLNLEQVTVKYKQFKTEDFGREVERLMIVKPPAVAVLPYDPVSNQIVLIEQFRIGAITQKSPWILEPVAGVVEEGDDLIATAKRELLEETGCEAQDLMHVMDYMSSPGISQELVHIYCAKVTAPLSEQYCGLDSECEDIKVRSFDASKISDLFCNSNNNAMLVVCLQWFLLNKDELRQKWT